MPDTTRPKDRHVMTHPTEPITRTLPLLNNDPTAGTASAAEGGGGCGCGGCGCGASATDTTPTPTAGTTVKENDVTTSTRSQSYSVTGMTCGHCVASVTEELEELAGVREVSVDLVAGGTSTVTVTSDQPLERDAVQAAVTEAGYQLA
jgi:copper chaperone